MSSLSPEIVSLVHHIELHESSWWEETVGRIALSCLLESRKPMDATAIAQAMRAGYGLQCDAAEIAASLQRLETLDKVMVAEPGKYVASLDISRSD